MGLSADHRLSEGARAQERQRAALRRFRGRRAVFTIGRAAGSLAASYTPLAVAATYEGFSGVRVQPWIFAACAACLMISPALGAVVFGLKNRVRRLAAGDNILYSGLLETLSPVYFLRRNVVLGEGKRLRTKKLFPRKPTFCHDDV